MSSTLSIIDLPALPLKHIFGFVGFKSLQRLRQVSKSIKNFIDTEKPSIQIYELRIQVKSEIVFIMLKSSRQNSCLHVREHQSGALVSTNTSKPRLQEKTFVDCSIEALEHVLKNRKFAIGKLKMELDDQYSKGKNSEFVEKFQKLLGADRLQVEELHLEGHEHQAIKLLKFFEAKTLKTIQFSSCNYSFEDISNDELMQFEQWKKAKTLNSRKAIYDVPIANFSHFDSADVFVNKITAQDLRYLRQIYTQSPSFKEATIHFLDSDLFDGKKQFFRCSDPNFALIFFSSRMHIRFSRVPISDVPVGTFGMSQ